MHGVFVVAAIAIASPVGVSVDVPATKTYVPPPALTSGPMTIQTSPSRPGLGCKLAARLRNRPDAIHRALVSGASTAQVKASGAVVLARSGPILSVQGSAEQLVTLARDADLVDSPQHLRPLLDISRVTVGADAADFADGFDRAYRGDGVLIATYDSGLDLDHPDFRDPQGESRVVAFWDQDRTGTPPEGQRRGHVCLEDAIDACPAGDRTGHGTHVMSIAAGRAPRYRGIAPAAQLVVARADAFDDLIGALDWFDDVAAARGQPMVVNLSLGGHEGAHDGTSMEAQALEALDHVVVAAAGNDGRIPVHATARLDEGRQTVALDLAASSGRSKAWIEIWGTVGRTLEAQVTLYEPLGAAVVTSSVVRIAGRGVTQTLLWDGQRMAELNLDAAPGPHPMNGRPHIRVELEVPKIEELVRRQQTLAIQIGGEGVADVWIDAPPDVVAFPRFQTTATLGVDGEITGDSNHSISDPATAPSVLAVSAFVSRTTLDTERGEVMTGGTLGEVSAFSSRGPSTDPERTGPKPDLAAPGQTVVGARSHASTSQLVVQTLYQALSGTSMAAPHVAGAAAVLQSARPDAAKDQIAAWILQSARRDERTDEDPRWGRGALDLKAALALAVDQPTCGCSTTGDAGWPLAAPLLILVLLWGRRRSL